MSNNIHYEYVDESSIDENYKCTICNEPFKSPTTTPCDHTYCQDCIEHWLNEGNLTCPACRHSLSVGDLKLITTRLILNILDNLLVKCTECKQSGIQRGNFRDHIEIVCPKRIVPCLASDIKCPWSGPREQLQEHLRTCDYERLRPVLNSLMNTNRQLEEQVQSLTNQVQVLQAAIQSPTKRLITFDKLYKSEKVDHGELPELYENLKWTNVWFMHKKWVKENHTLSGWKNAYTNDHICIAFNGKGNPMCICSKQPNIHTFNILSLEATAAWLDNLEVNVIGRRHNQDIYSTKLILQFDCSQVFHLNWQNIDQIEFQPMNGVAHLGIQYTEKYFAITWILLG